MPIRWQILSTASNEVNVLVRPDSYLTLHYRITLASGPGKDSVFADTFDGRPGHPVFLGRAHWPGLIDSLAGDEGARGYLAAHGVVEVECGDLATGRDQDTPGP